MADPAAIQSAREAARAALARRLKRLGVREQDLRETFARSSGPGGQHVNKVSTAVTLRHEPSGVSVTAQDSRSQSMNRALARERLLDEIERIQRERQQARRAEKAKERRRNSPRPRGVKERMLEGKRRRGDTKKMRGKVGE